MSDDAAQPRRARGPGAMRGVVLLAAAAIGWISGRGSALVVPVGSLGSPPGATSVDAASSVAPLDASPPASASAKASPSASGAKSPPPLDPPFGPGSTDELRVDATLGKLEALKRIELRDKTERTILDARALVRGHAELARRDGERLVEDLAREPALWSDRATLARLVELARDPSVAPNVLAELARTGHPTAADLFHALRAEQPKDSRLALYADDLLFCVEVRPTWSPALRIAIELEEVRGCPGALALVERAATQADERALAPLDRLGIEKGCGPRGEDDCFPCLRGDAEAKALVAAREAVRARPFARPWSLPGRR